MGDNRQGSTRPSSAASASDAPTLDGLFPDGFDPQTPVESYHPGNPRFVAVGEPILNPIWAVGVDTNGTPGIDSAPYWVKFAKGRDTLAPRLPELRADPSDYDASAFQWSLVDWPAESGGPDTVLSFASDSIDVPRYDEGRDNVAEFRADVPGWYTLELDAPDGTHELTVYAFERGADGGAAVYRGTPDGAPRIELEAEYDSEAGVYTIDSNVQAAPDVDSTQADLWTQFVADDRDPLDTSAIAVGPDGVTATIDEAELPGESVRVHAAAYDENVGKKSAQDVVEISPGGDVALPNRPPEWLANSVMYHIFPRSWAGERWQTTLRTLLDGDESTGAGGLDYLDNLGVDAVWLTPIVSATSVERQFGHRDGFDLRADNPLDDSQLTLSGGGPHGYDNTDYTSISQDLVPDGEGGIALYKEFIQQCNDRGIRVVFDLVINHMGVTSPLYRDTIGTESPNQYSEWPTVESWDFESQYFDWFARADTRREYAGDLRQAAPRPAGFADLRVMPNLNYNNLALREYILGVADFWSREVGVDGFRADIAYGIPQDLWTEMRTLVRGTDSEFLMFDETLPRDAALSEDMFSLHHDTAGFTTTAQEVVRGDTHAGNLFETIPQRQQDGLPDHSMFVNALENHDEHRILNQAAVDLSNPDHDGVADGEWEYHAERVRKCFAASITMPGVPHIYYGQERQISRFGEGRHMGDSDSRGVFDGSIDPSADVRPGGRQRAFMNWQEYPEDHFAFYQRLVEFYHDYEVLHPDADFEGVSYEIDGNAEDAEVLLFARDGSDLDIDGPDRVTVLINFGTGTETVRLSPETQTTDLFSGTDIAAANDDDTDTQTVVEVDDIAVLPVGEYSAFETVATWEPTDSPPRSEHGPGWYSYPTSSDFNDGAFDITRFEVQASDQRVRFVYEIDDLQNVYGGQNGYSLQYPHIFVRDPDRSPSREWGPPGIDVRFESPIHLWVEADGFSTPRVYDADENQVAEVQATGTAESNQITVEVPRTLFESDLADLQFVPALLGENQGGIRQVTATGGEYTFEDTRYADEDYPDPSDPWTRHTVLDVVTPAGLDSATALTYGIPEDPTTSDEAVLPFVDVADGPSATFTVSPSAPRVGEAITFDVSAGTGASYEWDVTGDGTTDLTGEVVTYTFQNAGERSVTLTVTASDGATDSVTKTVTVDTAGSVALTVADDIIGPGETATLSISAEFVERVTVCDLWRDWSVTADVPADVFDDVVDTAGRVELDWSGIQGSVSPTLDVSMPDRYVGGTYRLTVRGTNSDGESTEVTATIEVA